MCQQYALPYWVSVTPNVLFRPGPDPAAVVLEPLLRGRPFHVAQIPGRGRGLVASRPIAAGEVVLSEAPMLAYPSDKHQHQVCYHCLAAMPPGADVLRHRPTGRRFCSDACLDAALQSYLAVETAAAAARARSSTPAAGGGAGSQGGAVAAASSPAAASVSASGAAPSSAGAAPSMASSTSTSTSGSAATTTTGTASSSSTSTSAAAAAAAASGGGFSPLEVLYEQCRAGGERFPLLAARLAFMEVTAALAAAAQRCAAAGISGGGNSGSSGSGNSKQAGAPAPASAPSRAASAPAAPPTAASPPSPSAAPPPPPGGDPLRSMHVLCYANVPPPYPEAWVQQHALLAAALGAVARASPATLRNLAAAAAGGASGAAAAAGLTGPDAPARLAAAAAAAAERLTLDWFVGVLSRLHLNSFQVHNPLAGADPTDLAAAASALVADSGGGGAAAGSATYLLASLLNHSCEPSLELAFPGMDGTAAFVAARDIAAGEELSVSYMDVGLPYEARQRHLEWSYGFVCRCPRCREEGAAAAAEAAAEAARHGGSGGSGSSGSCGAGGAGSGSGGKSPANPASSSCYSRTYGAAASAAGRGPAAGASPFLHLPSTIPSGPAQPRRLTVAAATHSHDELEAVARERFGRGYDELNTEEKKSVGGIIGGRVRKEQLGHEGYQEMGHKGGEARKEQLGHEGYQEIGHQGGEARKEQLGHEGYQEMGHKGGEARKEQLGHEGYQEMGHKGGEARKEQLGHEGYQEMGHKGGEARKEQLGHEGYQEMGHKGGEARKEQLGHEGYRDMGHKGGRPRKHNTAAAEDKENLEPWRHWENAETKRRFHSLVQVSGLFDRLQHLKPRHATDDELARVHDPAYIARVKEMSADDSKGHHTAGDVATFAPGGYDIAALAAGGAIVATEAVLCGELRNAYALVRPPGHHAERGHGMGFCIFNNVAVAAAHALAAHGLKRVAVVDFDVHHGNGTQHIFESDPRVLFISIHQDSNYPLRSGYVTETGTGEGEGATLNLPLPPGSGSGAYRAAFQRVVLPALEAYKPELLLVSAGYDASYMDMLAAMILSSADFGWMMAQLKEAAERLCGGRLVALHEGGYSELYVPFCGLAALQSLSGLSTHVADPWLHEVTSWGYQELQPHQDAAITAAAAAPLDKLRARVAAMDAAGQ
ncbi:hypothetical protein HYH02_002272 [Chlamydomonas schloesseri]|uniref:SET domain-containing protein n=1 Tax=Chlamydomonas schloesseri TaxID=2026947 RepID=A0A836BB19_9CHLO|nr:hypothetical protein HYH02_002272 [Chlamydomonas schloesseri]|eukprot:KAG2452933.1 hypothetical protein HYH02_002272 [Chlamydomonas schloesseri]